MLVAVEGHALLGSFGQGHRELLLAIEEKKALSRSDAEAPSFLPNTDTAGLSRFFSPRALRQIDHFTRMALLGTSLALQGLEPVARTGIILASGYGLAGPTFAFMDSVLQYGEDMVSPLAFSHSVQNIPTATIARQLAITGPCLTICQPEAAFAQALDMAAQWLAQGFADRVVLVAADEQHPLLPQVVGWLYATQEREVVTHGIGEGCAAFVLCAPGRAGADLLPTLQVLTRLEDKNHLEKIPFFFSSLVPYLPDPAAHDANESVCIGADGYGLVPVAQALDVALSLALMAEPPSGEEGLAACLCVSISDGTAVHARRVHRP